ncbi:MAG: hypothetical protein ACE5QF_00135 [Thermoplasmata archaeon]
MRMKSDMDHRSESLLRATHGYVPGKDARGGYVASRMNITGFYITVALLLGFLSVLLFYAQFSGKLRWIIVVLLVSATAFGIAFIASRKTSAPERLSSPPAQEKKQWNEVARLIRMLRRAEKNYPYSQLTAVERVRTAIVETIQTQRDIDEDEMEGILHDRSRLVGLLDDEEVADFLLQSEKDLSNWSSIIKEKLPIMSSLGASRSFNQNVLHILEKMEEWR